MSSGMHPGLESLAVASWLGAWLLALPYLGRRSRWPLLWVLCLALVILLGLLRRWPTWEIAFPWLTAGRREYLLYGPLSLLLLGLPGLKLPRPATRWATAALSLLLAWEYSLAPFLWPPAPASLNSQGICLQGDSFTCGPAAAVTALGRLGFEADFQQLAEAAHTSPAIGTPPDLLEAALEQLYPVEARWLALERLQDLPPGQALLLLKLGPLVDHYVALLEQQPQGVIVADPLQGRVSLSWAEFAGRWRKTALVINRRPNPPDRR